MSKHRKALVLTLGGNPEKSYFTSNSRHSFSARRSNQGNLQSVLLLDTLAGHSTGSNFTKNHKNAENGQCWNTKRLWVGPQIIILCQKDKPFFL